MVVETENQVGLQNAQIPLSEKKLLEFSLLPEKKVLEKMETSIIGLSPEEAANRLKVYGLNSISTEKKLHVFLDLILRFKDPLVIQLMIICLVALVMQDFRSVTVVGGMLFISVFLSFFQERRSNLAVQELQKLVQSTVIVLRNKVENQLKISDVVPGDIVYLAAGSIIPADLRLISAKDFFVSESSLTGESIPIEKNGLLSAKKVTNVLELLNTCFQGCTVVSGTAKAVVINTGTNTILGSISKTISKNKDATSFDKGVKDFVWLMVRFMVVMVSTTFMIVGLRNHDWIKAMLFALSVAVGLTPEMLPMIITVCLSKGAMALSRKKVIVKKLKAIQNFGAINILCTDKTGTLTQDRIVLEKHVDVTNTKSEEVLKYAYMNSYYQTGLRNLLDKSILSHEDLDVEKTCRKVDEIPFDFVRKRMSVVIEYGGSHILICKGAVEEVYPICNQYQVDDDVFSLIDIVRNDLYEEYSDLSKDGYRVLAVAYREFPNEKEIFSQADEKDLTLLGYIAFYDPPKDSAMEAIAALRNSGVRVKILTGDNELVTRKICHDVNFGSDIVVTGNELSKMTAEKFTETILQFDIFARLTPSQKEQIILTLRNQGNVVGFLGDGINDAPALKAADVGISVDSAVDVAKESADIILLERSLLVLEDGILEGRRIFSNIIKYIKMGSSSNFGNMFSVVGGSFFLPFLPMSPILVLVNNLLYDVSQTGIPTDNVDPEFLKKPQRWDIKYVQKFMLFIGPISSIFDYATFFLMLYFFNCIAFSDVATSPEQKIMYEKLFQTGWFVESLLTQTLIVYIIRTNKIPFVQSLPSSPMLITSLIVVAFTVYLPYSTLGAYLGCVPLPVSYWAWILFFLISYSVLTHNIKVWFTKKFEVN